MGGEKALSLAGRFEPPHLALLFRIIHGPPNIEIGTMPNWLLVTDDADGRAAQLRFPDYYARAKRYYGKISPHRALVGVSDVVTDRAGTPIRLQVEWAQAFSTGDAKARRRYVMLPRYLDWNADKGINWLVGVDRAGPASLVGLLEAPSSVVRPLNSKVEKRAADCTAALSLTPSQVDAYQALRQYTNTVVWGPTDPST